MMTTPLSNIRDFINSLATESGEYYLACARTGDEPVPAAGYRFDSQEQARAGARATKQYRALLRRYDERAPQYEIVVCRAGYQEWPRKEDETGEKECRHKESVAGKQEGLA
ncbi:hypothetical protein ACFQJ7_00755 [Halovenus rubra]|uniref:Uncharacterized protein n=2 Tax=Halovenus rubra TaxID=869890 RepID=A0ACC7E070_9EURY|nr:hypothetical protein [Halovenus rubra]